MLALVGARNLDPPEEEYVARTGLRRAPSEAVADTAGVYVAVDSDALDAEELHSFLPEPGGLSLDEASRLLADLAGRTTVLGAGLTGLAPDDRNVEPVTQLCRALGL